MKRKLILFSVCVVIGCLALGISPLAAKEIKWRMTTTWPPSINLIECDKLFVKYVNDMCKGKLQIQFFEGGSLMPSFEVFDAVSKGVVQASGDWPNYWAGKDLVFDTLGSYPMGLTPFDYMVWYHHGGGREIYEEAYGKFGMMYLVVSSTTMESGVRSKKPVKKIEDLKGMKIRMSGRAQGYILEKLGVAQVAMAGQEIYQALQKGVIDAAEFSSPSTDWGMGFQEVTKYWLVPGWHQPASVLGVMINKKAWDELDDATKELVRTAAKAAGMEYITKVYYESGQYTYKFLEKGIEINRYPDTVLDTVQGLINEYSEAQAKTNPLFKKSLESQIAYRHVMEAWRDCEVPFNFGFNPKSYPKLD
jgi:TRAP-type mannitol/chloroaromatic compound transport system substrate-binding protein